MSTAPQHQKIRRIILTGAIAAVTISGAWYGAGLKTQNDTQQVIQKRREASYEEKLEQLETQRIGLVRRKIALEKKLGELEGRMAAKLEREPKESDG